MSDILQADILQPGTGPKTAGKDAREPEGAWAQSLALSFRFLFIAVYVLGFAWAVSNVRIVPPDSRAVVLRFGSIAREAGSGLLLAFPQPIEQVIVLPSADRQIEYPVKAFAAPGVIVVSGTQPSTGRAVLVSQNPRENAGMLLTGDMSVVHLDATLFYRITDARAYVLSADHVAPALERLFVASAVTVSGARDLDTILVARPELETSAGAARAGRERLRTDLMNEVNRRLAELATQGASLGITVGRVDLLPSIPGEAKNAFDSVLIAIQEAETKAAQARTQAEQMAQSANQQKDRIVTDAEARAAEQLTNAQTRTAAIAALGQGTPGLIGGNTLANQIYADRVGPLLGKAAQVLTTDGNGGAHLILPGTPR
jgi:regulator of protease activity HflC (stomatin/prohibitin superfamily)